MLCLLAAAQAVLIVFAAASLHAALPAVAASFQAAHPGVSVRFSFNGSQILEAQIANGAPADVFVSADKRWMDAAVRAGLVVHPAVFASNHLVVITPPHSPVARLADLAQPRVRLVICAEAVPCGLYTRRLLTGLERSRGFAPGFAHAVLTNVVSQELDVESVVSKVVLGEADAGIVYQTDARHQPGLRVIPVPAIPGTPIAYYIAPVRGRPQAALAASFAAFVRSAPGQAILARYGFTTAPR